MMNKKMFKSVIASATAFSMLFSGSIFSSNAGYLEAAEKTYLDYASMSDEEFLEFSDNRVVYAECGFGNDSIDDELKFRKYLNAGYSPDVYRSDRYYAYQQFVSGEGEAYISHEVTGRELRDDVKASLFGFPDEWKVKTDIDNTTYSFRTIHRYNVYVPQDIITDFESYIRINETVFRYVIDEELQEEYGLSVHHMAMVGGQYRGFGDGNEKLQELLDAEKNKNEITLSFYEMGECLEIGSDKYKERVKKIEQLGFQNFAPFDSYYLKWNKNAERGEVWFRNLRITDEGYASAEIIFEEVNGNTAYVEQGFARFNGFYTHSENGHEPAKIDSDIMNALLSGIGIEAEYDENLGVVTYGKNTSLAQITKACYYLAKDYDAHVDLMVNAGGGGDVVATTTPALTTAANTNSNPTHTTAVNTGIIIKNEVTTAAPTNEELLTTRPKEDVPLTGTYKFELSLRDNKTNEKIAGLECEMFNTETGEVLKKWVTEDLFTEFNDIPYAFEKYEENPKENSNKYKFAVRILNLKEKNYQLLDNGVPSDSDTLYLNNVNLDDMEYIYSFNKKGYVYTSLVFLHNTESITQPPVTASPVTTAVPVVTAGQPTRAPSTTRVPSTTAAVGTAPISSAKGDANCNGKVEISDAVAILQYLANSSKYPLSAQGKINADFDGDGITGADALTIQKMDAAMGGNSVFWKENPVISKISNSYTPNALEACANADKFDDTTEIHTPVFISKTAEEFDSLVDFISGEYNTKPFLNVGYYEFDDAVDIYKDNGEFFKDNFLIVVDIRANSGSIKHALNRVEKNDNGEIKVYIDRTSPMNQTQDMAEYFMFIECSKSALNDNSTFDAVLSEIKKGS